MKVGEDRQVGEDVAGEEDEDDWEDRQVGEDVAGEEDEEDGAINLAINMKTFYFLLKYVINSIGSSKL